jgi:hypothetical protein
MEDVTNSLPANEMSQAAGHMSRPKKRKYPIAVDTPESLSVHGIVASKAIPLSWINSIPIICAGANDVEIHARAKTGVKGPAQPARQAAGMWVGEQTGWMAR